MRYHLRRVRYIGWFEPLALWRHGNILTTEALGPKKQTLQRRHPEGQEGEGTKYGLDAISHMEARIRRRLG